MQSLSSPAFPVTPDKRIPFFTFASFPQTFCSYMMGVPYFNNQENEFLTLSEDCSPRGTRPRGNQHVLSAYCMLSGTSLWLSSLWDPHTVLRPGALFRNATAHLPPHPCPRPVHGASSETEPARGSPLGPVPLAPQAPGSAAAPLLTLASFPLPWTPGLSHLPPFWSSFPASTRPRWTSALPLHSPGLGRVNPLCPLQSEWSSFVPGSPPLPPHAISRPQLGHGAPSRNLGG